MLAKVKQCRTASMKARTSTTHFPWCHFTADECASLHMFRVTPANQPLCRAGFRQGAAEGRAHGYQKGLQQTVQAETPNVKQ